MSGLPLNAPAKSTLLNETYTFKKDNDTITAIHTLSNTDPSSGDSVPNKQGQINKNKKVVNVQQNVANDGTLVANTLSQNQEFRMVGDGGPTNLNLLPFGGSKVFEDGAEILLIGHDDTNTVTVRLNDVNFGCYINDNAVLKRGYILRLVYNDELKRYLEIGRNF